MDEQVAWLDEIALLGAKPVTDSYIGLDYETYCDLDLTVVGLDQYVNHSSFDVLVACVSYSNGSSYTFDFIQYPNIKEQLNLTLKSATMIAVHNAGFERAVTKALGIDIPATVFVDTAVLSRCMGGASKLELAAPQWLGVQKMASGMRLIRKFSMNGCPTWDEVKDDDDWVEFKEYCLRDAQLTLKLWAQLHQQVDWNKESQYEAITQRMNDIGWPVDMTSLAHMERRYEDNKVAALKAFRDKHDPEGELNFNSPIQLIKWMRERGINATSVDENSVIDMVEKIFRKIQSSTLNADQHEQYQEVMDLLYTKQTLGGSALKKLAVIRNTVGPGNRLRGQYMHCGAGQSYRTSGRGVQMQNLTKLAQEPRQMSHLGSPASQWTNDDMSENIRQLFTASSKYGRLIVGDFSSVEARGLAYLTGNESALTGYARGSDMYKIQAALMYKTSVTAVDAHMRIAGKVAVLACGYQAGGGAVQSFAARMGIPYTLAEAQKLVDDWRDSNPLTVELWDKLQTLLLSGLMTGASSEELAQGMRVTMRWITTPDSLLAQHPGAQSLEMTLLGAGGLILFSRAFQGVYKRGKDVCYYKPDGTNGQLWSAYSTDPKTKQKRYHNLYGGKLTGILVQSMCRDIFFRVVSECNKLCMNVGGLSMIGQFHDEIVFDYDPTASAALSLDETTQRIKAAMSFVGPYKRFPLAADIKSDYRYIK